MKVQQALREAVSRLDHAGVSEPRPSATLLMAHALGVERHQVVLRHGDEMSRSVQETFSSLIDRRLKHEPIQYILGQWDFAGFSLVVQPGVLIPRPETEDWLVPFADLLRARFPRSEFAFADVGTGTGIIALFLHRAFPRSRGWLVDLSPSALATARENVRRHAPAGAHLFLVNGDLLGSIRTESLDVVVSNPPYIPASELPALMPDVRDYEPKLALDGGDDGLTIVRRLLEQSRRVLRPLGICAFEHGFGQREAVLGLLGKDWKLIVAGDDLGRRDRYVVVEKIV